MRPSHQVTRLSQFGRILWTMEYNNNRSSENNMIIIGNQEKKNSKQNKRKLSMFQFQTHYQEPRRKKSVWDPISKPLSLFLHLPIIVIPKNLEQNFPQKNRYFPKNLEQPQKSFANQVVMEGGVRPKPSRNCRFCAGEVFSTIWVFSFIA